MKKEKGAVMVEAVIIFPIVLFTVFFLIYLGLFKLQEMATLYQVQRVAHQGALAVASPGYEKLGDYQTKQIEFASAPAEVDEYYKAFHSSLTVLYREIFGSSGWMNDGDMQAFMNKMSDEAAILAGVSYLDNSVRIKRGLLSTRVEAEVVFGFDTPGILKYFGFDDEIKFKQGASATALSPSGMVRNVDLAGDAIVVISEKLGIKGDLDKILNGIKKYLF